MSAVRGLSALSAVLVVGAFVALMGGRTPAFEVGSVADQVSAAIEAKADPAPLHLLAERTVDRLLVFRTSDGPASMTLGSDEVTALITETLPGLLPAGVDDVDIVVRNGGILLRAQVLTDDWVGVQRLRSVMAVLPDILHAEVDGNLVRIGRRLRLQVSSARVNGVWLPGPIVDAPLGGTAHERNAGRRPPFFRSRFQMGLMTCASSAISSSCSRSNQLGSGR